MLDPASEEVIWRPLPLASPSQGVPVLLVAASIGPAAYTIRVSDMANVWTEELDRKGICMRAWKENTSIDPSDTPENMAKLLGNLRSALDPCQPGHDLTSLTLSPGSIDGVDGLTLRITCRLPGLQPLKWPVYLRKSPPSAVATDLVLPLIQGHHARRLEMESLTQVLSHKDAVIAKLVDKLDATGTGLENVFAGLSSGTAKKKASKALAEDKIKGLAPFDEGKWKADLRDHDQRRPTNVDDLVRSVFDAGGAWRSEAPLDVEASMSSSPTFLDKWWQGDFKATSQPARGNKADVPGETTPEDADDDDFEVQATPPRLGGAPVPDDASTEGSTEGEDEEEEAHADPVPKPRSRMGVIGGTSQTHAPAADASGSETASDDDAPPPPPPRIGTIGRIRKSPVSSPGVAEEDEETRADRRREELKKKLAMKAAIPAKRRRF